ncbi:MAG: glycosyltransferase family 39 protein [Solirubrobacterales bacterium]|nr:glycosyltransferase family 39 protein [Solirubrobacterales bacterium]
MSSSSAVEIRRRPAPARAAARTRRLTVTREAAVVIGLTLLAALLRFWRIGHQGFWFDEANTALLVHFSPGRMLGLIPRSESTPPLYYCLAWVWARVFGYTEAPLRSLSAVAGVATVPLAYGAAAKLISTRAGTIAAALTACSPLLIWYSQEARSYALLVLFTSAALFAFAHARSSPGPRPLTAWAIASALALATHYYAVLAIVPEAVWLLALHRRRRPVQVAVAVVAACGLALIPLALSQKGTGRSNWIATVSLLRRLGEVLPQSLLGFGAPAWAVLGPVALAITALALVLLVTRSRPRERSGALVAAGIAVGGLGVNLLMIAAGVDDLITRNLLALWLPAAVVVAGGLAAGRARRLGLAFALVLCALGVTAAVGVAVDRNLERPDWRVVARLLGPRPAGAGPRAILVAHYRDLLPLSLYLPGLRFSGRAGARVSELDVVEFTSPPSAGFCWWGSACNLWPVRTQHRFDVPGFHEAWERHALQFTVIRLIASRPVRLGPREVGRAVRTTRLRNDEFLLQR